MNDSFIPYEDNIIHAKTDGNKEAYIDVLDNYIGTEVVFPEKDYIPILDKNIKHKCDYQGNPIKRKIEPI